ncbi:hypothetical protein Ahy_B07g088770 [Arachis hypogaea]|uniref:Uncharacterized protein n=1 Tax=Arachis hypogaea TaxID=3818 RepID=A0A444YFD7_ARAHY|nr:hypothetical protein Ahy_B07g088770 [Arachis hypogaea]
MGSDCGIQGPISSSFYNLTHLTSLNLADNQLNGSISSSLLNLQRLTHLDLSRNELSGQIPNRDEKLKKEKGKYTQSLSSAFFEKRKSDSYHHPEFERALEETQQTNIYLINVNSWAKRLVSQAKCTGVPIFIAVPSLHFKI